MTRVGVVGLGVMGAAVGRRLVDCGAAVTGVDVRVGARAAWHATADAPGLASVEDAGRQDAWFVVVRTGAQAAAVVADVAAASTAGGTSVSTPVYVLTTLRPDEAEALAGSAPVPVPERPVSERPVSVRAVAVAVWPVAVSGGEPAALRGQLVAAVPDALPPADRQFLRATVAAHLVDMGGPRQVALAKVLVNAMISYQFRALERLMRAAEAGGVTPAAWFDLLQRSSAGSPALAAVLTYDAALADADGAVTASLGPVDPGDVGPSLAAVRRRLRLQ